MTDEPGTIGAFYHARLKQLTPADHADVTKRFAALAAANDDLAKANGESSDQAQQDLRVKIVMDGHSDSALLAKPGYRAMSDSVNNLPGVRQQVAKIETAFAAARRYTASLKNHHGASLLAAGDTVPVVATDLAMADAFDDTTVSQSTAMANGAAAYATGVASFSPDSATLGELYATQELADSESTWAWHAEEEFYLNGGSPEWALNSPCGLGGSAGTIANVQAWPGWLIHAAVSIAVGVIRWQAGNVVNAKLPTVTGAEAVEAGGEAEAGTELAGSGIIDWLIGLLPFLEVVHAPHGTARSQ